ncbi:MAG: 50S ribosomal protein L18 [Candidatus Diapherotrites archaeon]|uniref:Large ribosomal subunit protein uL18 n=1 Tax=Candidatus Iainarchaeum sp. TaxID=3101447 RepID=A0A2D6M0M2_9ARCH|nr:50S ribosomal protein L18 [Candidatus Diapherotrites archaeon]|tara:strand:+ start:5913 stop:6512 length:600 start_codon:yes stop_codon:yes gene_type:complete
MKATSTYEVPFRRRKEGKTNYKKRLASIKSGLPRMCVRKSNKHIVLQLIAFEPKGDKALVHVSSKHLEQFGWLSGKNLPSAYLTGMLLAAKAKKSNVNKAILDIGFNTPIHGSRIFSALKGAVDNGLDVKFEETALPSEERASGKHIEDYAKSLNDEELKKHFSKYIEKGINVKELTKLFNEVKEKIAKDSGKETKVEK